MSGDRLLLRSFSGKNAYYPAVLVLHVPIFLISKRVAIGASEPDAYAVVERAIKIACLKWVRMPPSLLMDLFFLIGTSSLRDFDFVNTNRLSDIMQQIAVIIPTYKARNHILDVLREIGPEVARIYVIDDCCPDHSGEFVMSNCQDVRVSVIRHEENQGVGGAVMTGYKAAIDDGMGVLIKIDSDGQMDPALIMDFAAPIIDGEADYTKGNRFFDLEKVRSMPMIRLFGNAALSLMCKLSSGYWNLFDPTNGYTAIHADVARHLPFNKISRRYFFETDMLFRLNVLRAVVVDVPMEAKYGDEISNLSISKVIGEFLIKHVRNFAKRIFYNYYLRDMSLASIELPVGIVLLCFGVVYGGYHWVHSAHAGSPTPAGTVMLAALPILGGIQFLLGFIGHDVSSVPVRPVHRNFWKLGIKRR